MAKVDALVVELKSAEPEAVERALRSLSRRGIEVLGKLLDRLEDERDPGARVNLLRALGRVTYDAEHFEPAHLERLRKHAAAQGLERAAEPRALFELATFVKVLGMAGDLSCLEDLLRAMGHGDARVRSNAIEGVAFLVRRWKVACGARVQAALEAAAADEVARVSVTATAALFVTHGVAADLARARLQELSTGDDDASRVAAQSALASLGIERRPLLERLAKDSFYSLLERYDRDGWA